MKHYQLLRFETPDALAESAAAQWLDMAAEAHQRNQDQLVAISGGGIARNLFSAIATLAREKRNILSHVHFFWADERCVGPDHEESNFLMAKQLLFTPLEIPTSRIHRIRGEDDPEEAARAADGELRHVASVPGSSRPSLDMIFLGMGDDGHVASLFPDAPMEVIESPAIYVPVIGSKPPPRRVSLTYASIFAARNVWALVSGSGKERALREALAGEGEQTPMARVLKGRSSTTVFTDLKFDASSQETGRHFSESF